MDRNDWLDEILDLTNPWEPYRPKHRAPRNRDIEDDYERALYVGRHAA